MIDGMLLIRKRERDTTDIGLLLLLLFSSFFIQANRNDGPLAWTLDRCDIHSRSQKRRPAYAHAELGRTSRYEIGTGVGEL